LAGRPEEVGDGDGDGGDEEWAEQACEGVFAPGTGFHCH